MNEEASENVAAESSVMTPSSPSRLPARGRVGILSLILTESAFFSIFVAAYAFYIGKSAAGPFPRDVLRVPVFNTVCLLSSSITIVLAVRALKSGSVRSFGLWWLLTLGLGLEFMIGTVFEWHRLIYQRGFTIATNLFGTTYYSLVGLHALHVTVGLLAILFVFVMAVLGHVDESQAERTDILSWYWHFVDAVWVVVFLTVYVVGR